MTKMALLRKELLRIKKSNNGVLKPEDVVNAARSERSILHHP